MLTVANADVSKVSDETLTDLADEAKGIVKKREREAAAEARRIVRIVDMGERARALLVSHPGFVAPVSDMETYDDVAEEDRRIRSRLSTDTRAGRNPEPFLFGFLRKFYPVLRSK